MPHPEVVPRLRVEPVPVHREQRSTVVADGPDPKRDRVILMVLAVVAVLAVLGVLAAVLTIGAVALILVGAGTAAGLLW
jgi:hypothetical protein